MIHIYFDKKIDKECPACSQDTIKSTGIFHLKEYCDDDLNLNPLVFHVCRFCPLCGRELYSEDEAIELTKEMYKESLVGTDSDEIIKNWLYSQIDGESFKENQEKYKKELNESYKKAKEAKTE